MTYQRLIFNNKSLYIAENDLTFTGLVIALSSTLRLDNNTFTGATNSAEPLPPTSFGSRVYFGCLAQFPGTIEKDGHNRPINMTALISICQLPEFLVNGIETSAIILRAGGLVPEFI